MWQEVTTAELQKAYQEAESACHVIASLRGMGLYLGEMDYRSGAQLPERRGWLDGSRKLGAVEYDYC